MRGKRGQFYILAAVIIISVIIGFTVIRNLARTEKETTRIYDLGEELKLETGSVFDYGIYNEEDTGTLVEDWTKIYYEYATEQEAGEWILIYGNEQEMTALSFSTTSSGEVGIITGGSAPITLQVEKTIIDKKEFSVTEGKIDVTFRNYTYQFNLKPAENFFFLIQSGKYTAKSEE